MAGIEKLLKERWAEIQKAIKAKWGQKISDDDLAEAIDNQDVLCELVSSRCGLDAQSARREVKSILDGIQSGAFRN